MHKIASVQMERLSKEIGISNDLELKKFVMYLESLCVDYTSSLFSYGLL